MQVLPLELLHIVYEITNWTFKSFEFSLFSGVN